MNSWLTRLYPPYDPSYRIMFDYLLHIELLMVIWYTIDSSGPVDHRDISVWVVYVFLFPGQLRGEGGGGANFDIDFDFASNNIRSSYFLACT